MVEATNVKILTPGETAARKTYNWAAVASGEWMTIDQIAETLGCKKSYAYMKLNNAWKQGKPLMISGVPYVVEKGYDEVTGRIVFRISKLE